MATDVSICNLALFRVGVQQTIASMTEQSQEARACNVVYTQCREALLREFPWSFAERIGTLALVQESPNSLWDYEYQCPSDALRINSVVDPSGKRNPQPPIPFRITSSTQGRLIWTDVEDAEAAYNVNITDTTLFDPLFVDALAWKIAHEIAPVLSNDANFAAKAEVAYLRAVAKAVAVNLNEEGQEERRCSILEARE